MALAYHQAGRLTEAETLYQQILQTHPDHPDALHLLGMVAHQSGQNEIAAQLISRAIQLNPNDVYNNNLGAVYLALSQPDQALACLKQAIALNPTYAEAHNNLGNALSALGKLDEATQCYNHALSINPDYAEAHNNLGNLLRIRGNAIEATNHYRKAIALIPDYAEAHNNLGNALRDLGQLDAAATCYRQAITARTNFPDAYYNLGTLFQEQERSDEALTSFEQALRIRPDFADTYNNMGATLKSQEKLAAARTCFEKAIESDPRHTEAFYNLGNVLRDQGKQEAALYCFGHALGLNPDFAKARWAITMAQLPLVFPENQAPASTRSDFATELDKLESWFESREVFGIEAVGTLQPFYLAYHEANNRDLLARYGSLCCRLMKHWLDRQEIIQPERPSHGDIIRIGVVSAHICDHPVWNAIVRGWFEHLDRSRFELHVFYLGAKEDNETTWARERSASFTQGARNLRLWIDCISGKRPDVLIYPEIGMNQTTAKLACLGLAPLQIATWGHPETTGLPTIDYYLSAEDLEPADAQDCYSERLVMLPHLGCCYSAAPVTAIRPDFAALGIDPDIPILLCPGSPFKYAPEHDAALVEIARRLGHCTLVFFTFRIAELSTLLKQRLTVKFAQAGLDFHDYCRFIPWQDKTAFYGLMQHATVFLDTIGFSGFNTAMQAIECGLPVVTREGRFMRGRLASGILHRMSLPELVADSDEAYVALAVRLAQDNAYREQMRHRIAASRGILFDDVVPLRALEKFIADKVTP